MNAVRARDFLDCSICSNYVLSSGELRYTPTTYFKMERLFQMIVPNFPCGTILSLSYRSLAQLSNLL